MSKTKIAFFADVLLRDYDGCNRTIFHIIDRFDKSKYDILFFSSIFPNDFPYAKVEITNITFPFNKKYKMAIPQLNRKKIDEALKSFSPDIIHITTPSPLGFYALSYGNQNNIPISTIYHTHYISYVDYYLRDFPLGIPLAKSKFINWTKNFCENCNTVFVPTESIKKELINYNIDSRNMKIWPRGIDKKIFSPLKANKKHLQSITQNTNDNILFASRLVWEKNIRTLIHVYDLIEKYKLPYNLIVAGDGVAMQDMKNEMPKATFLGNLTQTELSKVYASSDIFLFPSISETFGNVVIEAMASGLPCVIANGGGSSAFITQGDNGFLCTPNNASDYLEKINLITNNKNIRDKIKVNGLKYAQQLNWEELVSNMLEHWETLKRNNIKSTLEAA